MNVMSISVWYESLSACKVLRILSSKCRMMSWLELALQHWRIWGLRWLKQNGKLSSFSRIINHHHFCPQKEACFFSTAEHLPKLHVSFSLCTNRESSAYRNIALNCLQEVHHIGPIYICYQHVPQFYFKGGRKCSASKCCVIQDKVPFNVSKWKL